MEKRAGVGGSLSQNRGDLEGIYFEMRDGSWDYAGEAFLRSKGRMTGTPGEPLPTVTMNQMTLNADGSGYIERTPIDPSDIFIEEEETPWWKFW